MDDGYDYDKIPFGIHFLKCKNSYFVVLIKISLLTRKKEKTLNDYRYFYTNALLSGRLILRLRVRTINLLKKWDSMSWFKRVTKSFVVFTKCQWDTPIVWEKRETVEQAEDRLGHDAVFNSATII